MSQDISSLRREYEAGGLHEEGVDKDPIRQFGIWFQAALDLGIDLANAMVLATADEDGTPTARYVLLKEYGEDGFIFYTNRLSQKGREMEKNPRVALVLYWREMHRQIRIEGGVEELPAEKIDAYFRSRPRGSQISAWVAPQSEVIASRDYLEAREAALIQEFDGKPVPRPEAWAGYRVKPVLIEFWQGQANRLHDRIRYRQVDADTWEINRLAP